LLGKVFSKTSATVTCLVCLAPSNVHQNSIYRVVAL
jgi:hypothetical protein